MIDRLCKKILIYMNKSSDCPSEKCYDFDEDIDKIATDWNTDSESIRLAIGFLEKSEYISFGFTQSGIALNFYLDHKGLHWKEFRRAEIIKYLEEKWIDFLAMLLALAALLISLIK